MWNYDSGIYLLLGIVAVLGWAVIEGFIWLVGKILA